MDLHADALDKIMGDMDGMEQKKLFPSNGGATITISIAPGGEGEPDGDEGQFADLPEDHDISLCGGGCAMHKGGEVATTSEELPADHDSLACNGECPIHRGVKSGATKGGNYDEALTMAAGGQVPGAPAPAEVDDMRVPPFLRKKKA